MISRTCATGSARFTKSCSARARARAFGSFVALYGIEETRALIAQGLSGELVS